MLEKYREKRDFSKTPEPAPGSAPAAEGPLMFVVQKHAATRLHYDFRLEINGALASWPVPKGPSYNPKDKRLAVMVEDHPLDYASFEGIIPKGEYGAGQVIVWDAGSYSPDEDGMLSFDDHEEANRRMSDGLANGKLSILLRGHKLKGSWTLVKISNSEKDWLLIKHKDRFADAERDVALEDRSIVSGLTIEDLKAGRLPDRRRRPLMAKPADVPGAVRAAMPSSVSPMHATLTEHAFSAPDWLFEPKLDGVRAIAFIDRAKIQLRSRRGLDSTRQYADIAQELAEQVEPQMVLDGEIVAFDETGVPSFQKLQGRMNLQRAEDIRKAVQQVPVVYYVFDLLYATGYDLRGARLSDRKELLGLVLLPTDRVLPVQAFDEDGVTAFEAARDLGLEGVIAKRRDSTYESGKRSRSWLKVKATQEQEFVIGGYTGGEGSRSDTFGSLLLGYYDGEGKDGLRYVGHVGTGFDDRRLIDLKSRLESLRTDANPFSDEVRRGSMVFGRPRSVPVHWVKPELIAQVKFVQWTDEGYLRAPSFLGLTDDKAPLEVRREEVAPPPKGSETQPNREIVSVQQIEEVLEQLDRKADKLLLKVDGHKIPLNNLDKEFWPPLEGRRALTKRDLLVYLARVSPVLLPHMRNRPITLTRYPNGIAGGHFYQKHWEPKLPEFVSTVELYSEQYHEDQDYLICNNLPTLLWLGQLADIELHTWYSRVNPEPDGHHLPASYTGSARNFDRSLLNYPDFIVFDLDPYIYSGQEARGAEPELNRAAFLKTCDVALWLKEVLDSLSLSSFVKTTGKTGLHVYVPVLRQFDYETVRSFAESIGRFLMQSHRKDITMDWSVEKRTGKIFFDHNQNTKGKTLASIYSPRPSPSAAVSMPLRWDELRLIYPTNFTILTAYDRIEKTGDLWANILDQKHDLAGLLGALPA